MNVGLPRSFGRYVLHSVVGVGGMATVYRAELQGPAGFRKTVAIKVPTGTPGHSQDARDLFGEGRIGGRLGHRNLIDVYEVGEVEGRAYIAMEYVDGLPLSRLLRAYGRLPLSVSMEIAVAVVRGLCAAHELPSGDTGVGLVHRDLKPANVLVSWDGEVKITDFGIATWSQRSSGLASDQPVVGTPRYMAPEQARGDGVDPRADLFSLGILLGELLLGAFCPSPDRAAHPWAVATHPLVRAMDGLVPGFGEVVWRCVQADPGSRYPSARAVLTALLGLQEELTVNPRLEVWLAGAVAPPPWPAVPVAPVPARLGRARSVLLEDTLVRPARLLAR